MSSIVISCDTSGSITLSSPAVAGSNTVTMPAASGVCMVSGNMPAFSAYANTIQTLTSGTFTKIILDTKQYDTNNNFDSTTNYRFTPTVAGYYQITGNLLLQSTTSITRVIGNFYKNGVALTRFFDLSISNTTAPYYINGTSLLYMNGSTDYLELYAFASGTATIYVNGSFPTTSYLQGVLVRTA
jgi:hypothetical protein